MPLSARARKLLATALLLPAAALAEGPGAGPARPPGEVSIIILGGGKTPAAADAWRKAHAGDLRALAQRVTLPSGHPKSLASASVAGLNPGFQIVSAGVCQPADAERVLTLIKADFPDAYTRMVKVPDDQIACPSVAATIPLVTFDDEGGKCHVQRTVPGEAAQDWGSVPGPCPKRTWDSVTATRTPEGRVVVGLPAGAIERDYTGKVRTLPALPAPWALDWTGLQVDGTILATGRFTGPDAGVAPKSRWIIDGRAVEFEWEAGSERAVLCGVFTLDGAGWKRTALRPRGLKKGGPEISCPAQEISVDARPPLRRPTAGSATAKWTALPDGPVDGLVDVAGPFAAKAMGGWLEGPLYFTNGGLWRRIEGFEARDPLAVQAEGEFAIACSPRGAALLSVTDGSVGWTGAHCPIVWDQ
ncbi:MAG: hypothetical protein R3F59_20820 [Myxococcota bacterium]